MAAHHSSSTAGKENEGARFGTIIGIRVSATNTVSGHDSTTFTTIPSNTATSTISAIGLIPATDYYRRTQGEDWMADVLRTYPVLNYLEGDDF